MKEHYHHGQLRMALIEAAAEVAATSGVHAIRMRPLARAVGVSSGAPFRHFRTVEHLLVAVAEEGAQRQLAVLRAAVHPEAGPMEQQRQMGVAYVGWAVRNPGYFRVLSRVESLQGSETLQEMQAAFIATLHAALQGTVGAPPGAGLSDELASSLGARALVYGLARMAVDGLLGADLTGEQAEAIAHRVTGAVHLERPKEDP